MLGYIIFRTSCQFTAAFAKHLHRFGQQVNIIFIKSNKKLETIKKINVLLQGQMNNYFAPFQGSWPCPKSCEIQCLKVSSPCNRNIASSNLTSGYIDQPSLSDCTTAMNNHFLSIACIIVKIINRFFFQQYGNHLFLCQLTYELPV